MALVIYGIKNCDTMKKALTWLNVQGVAHTFHDYKVAPPTEKQLARWCEHLTWEKVLNRAGTTFRKLPDADKANLSEAKAIALMVAQPSMIKRPLVEDQNSNMWLVGFAPDAWSKVFG